MRKEEAEITEHVWMVFLLDGVLRESLLCGIPKIMNRTPQVKDPTEPEL